MTPSSPNKRKLVLLIAGILFLVAALSVTGILIFKARSATPISLVFLHPFEAPAWKEALEAESREFENLFKGITVELKAMNLADLNDLTAGSDETWDLALSPSLAGLGERIQGSPNAFTGSLWGIYANPAVLKKAGIVLERDAEGLGGRIASGAWSLEDFKEACAAVKKTGVSPIALGSQYGWPLAVWVQSFMAASDPLEARALTTDSFNPAAPSIKGAIDTFASLIQDGFVDPAHASKDWPQSIQEVLKGRAAFCLVNEGFISSLRLSDRKGLTWLAPPGSMSGGKSLWAIGSLQFIGRRASLPKASAKAADRYLAFLSSQGVTERLSRTLGAPFFSAGTGPQTVLPSISSQPTSPVIQVMKEGVGR